MDASRRERVDDWQSRSVPGLEGLDRLAAEGFSGAARAGDAAAFLLNGRVVGVVGGDLETAFRDAAVTAASAPHDALPLLFAMQEAGGETRAKYYTNDTPLSEVDETLSTGNFTGYVELSENVLSGDYYLVYHGGERLCVAFVGASEEVVAGQEAYDLAADEVGIYEVVQSSVTVQEVPAPPGAGSAGAAGTSVDAGESEAAPSDADGATDATDESESTPSDADEGSDAADESEVPIETAAGPEAATGVDAEPVERADEGNVEADAESAAPESSPGPADAESAPETAGEASPEEAAPTGGDEADATASEPTDAVADSEDPFAEEAEWRETVSIPAVDPDESAATEDGEEAADRPAPGSQERQAAAATTGQPRERSRPTEGPSRQELRETLEARTEALAEARERLESATEERDEVAAERDRLRDRVDDLEEEVATLRSDLATRTDDAATETGGVARSPADALAGTDLFVRYGSRGEATLEDVPDGAGSEAVRSNLRLDHHTQFEAEETTVGGDDYEAFLRDTVEYGFVSWLVETLPFEIRETDHEGALRDLYEALPEIDRVEFGGTVSVEDGDDRSFDVVARDRMGGPLVVGDINDRRDPVADEMLTDLVDAASAVAADRDVAGAFYVTASFFEPDALDVAAAATGGGLLSRDKRASYVKESRKRGFHLCLVETRNGSFYLNVPEL